MQGAGRATFNMLTPVGVLRRAWLQDSWERKEFPRRLTEATAPCVLAGETAKAQPVFDPTGSLPDAIGCWISTEQGVRRLQREELAKGKGIPNAWSNE